MRLVELRFRFANLLIIVEASDQEERLDDILHRASGRFHRLFRVLQREPDLILCAFRRGRAGAQILADTA